MMSAYSVHFRDVIIETIGRNANSQSSLVLILQALEEALYMQICSLVNQGTLQICKSSVIYLWCCWGLCWQHTV